MVKSMGNNIPPSLDALLKQQEQRLKESMRTGSQPINPETYYDQNTLNYLNALKANNDICTRTFEYAKNLGFYTDEQRYTKFWLDINNNENPVQSMPAETNYAALHPAQKKVVLAGLAQIADQNIRYEKYVEEQRKLKITKAKDGCTIGAITLVLGIAIGIGTLIFWHPKNEDVNAAYAKIAIMWGSIAVSLVGTGLVCYYDNKLKKYENSNKDSKKQ